MKNIAIFLLYFLPMLSWAQIPECELPIEQETEQEEEKASDEIVFFAEKMPSFPGGEAAMHQFIVKSVQYPEIDREAGIQGRVYVRFVVELDGRITGIEILRGLSKTIDAECIRVIKKMPLWIPAENPGGKVRCYYTMPFTFRLG